MEFASFEGDGGLGVLAIGDTTDGMDAQTGQLTTMSSEQPSIDKPGDPEEGNTKGPECEGALDSAVESEQQSEDQTDHGKLEEKVENQDQPQQDPESRYDLRPRKPVARD